MVAGSDRVRVRVRGKAPSTGGGTLFHCNMKKKKKKKKREKKKKKKKKKKRILQQQKKTFLFLFSFVSSRRQGKTRCFVASMLLWRLGRHHCARAWTDANVTMLHLSH
jgi:hypothetical protein